MELWLQENSSLNFACYGQRAAETECYHKKHGKLIFYWINFAGLGDSQMKH